MQNQGLKTIELFQLNASLLTGMSYGVTIDDLWVLGNASKSSSLRIFSVDFEIMYRKYMS